MKVKTAVLFATALASLGLAGLAAQAQVGPQPAGDLWGPPVRARDSSEVMHTLGDQLGMIRSNQLFWQQVNALQFTGNGTMVDLEAGLGEAFPVSKYTYQSSLQIPASRVDVEGPGRERTVAVVRGDLDQAWNETKPGYVAGPSDQAALREQQIWLWPHAFARAAAYAEQGKCPDGTDCADAAFALGEEGGRPVITVTVGGVEYKGTLGEDNRPATIEATLEIPGVGPATYVASYSNYRNGLGLGTAGEEVGQGVRGLAAAGDIGAARGEGILDKFHTGAYFPGNVLHQVNGTTVLEIELTEAWPNAFMIFPTPEQLAAAQ